MKRILIALMFGLLLQPAAGRAADPSLYQRLGGYDAIAAVTRRLGQGAGSPQSHPRQITGPQARAQ
jgi:hypothetical protein